MTPAELDRVAVGHRKREDERREEQRELLAWAVAKLMNASGWLKRPVRYDALLRELLGEKRMAERLRAEAEQMRTEG